jgi:hypothetical protein
MGYVGPITPGIRQGGVTRCMIQIGVDQFAPEIIAVKESQQSNLSCVEWGMGEAPRDR